MNPKRFKKYRFEQIRKFAEKYNVSFDYKMANTGTFYIELSGEEETVTVRVADHPDAYASAEFNCDPDDCDDIARVKEWIQSNGYKDKLSSDTVYAIAEKYHIRRQYDRSMAVWDIFEKKSEEDIFKHIKATWEGADEEDIICKFEAYMRVLKAVKRDIT